MSTMKETPAQTVLTQLVKFCREHGGDCYRGFTDDILREYLEFHIHQGTLGWLRGLGHEVLGCAVAWQCNAAEIKAAADADKYFFQWQKTNPKGDALFIADVIGLTPWAMAALIEKMDQLFPGWQQRLIYTWRHGRLVELNARTLMRITKGKE